VGIDRGLKRLSLRRLEDVKLLPYDEADADAPQADLQTTLHDALSLMLAGGSERLVVVDENGRPVGSLNLEVCSRFLSPRAEVASEVTREVASR
jgi:CBS domain-containing protein